RTTGTRPQAPRSDSLLCCANSCRPAVGEGELRQLESPVFHLTTSAASLQGTPNWTGGTEECTSPSTQEALSASVPGVFGQCTVSQKTRSTPLKANLPPEIGTRPRAACNSHSRSALPGCQKPSFPALRHPFYFGTPGTCGAGVSTSSETPPARACLSQEKRHARFMGQVASTAETGKGPVDTDT
ncbi:hypothetical protein CSUI_009144, partial [Cystoisospora suis]